MSKLKTKLKGILPSLSEEANRCKDPEIKERYYLIRAVVNSPKSVTRACAERGRSTDYFNKWGKRLYKQKSLTALKPQSRQPNYSPKMTQKRVTKRVRRLREAEPFQGPERISYDLKQLFNIDCPPSTVYSILKREKLITADSKKKLTKRHMKRYRRPLPGYLQMDVKYVPQLVEGQQYYEMNAVDHCTTWRFFRILPSLDHFCVARFLRELKENCPFPIIELQTDNGGEFTDKYRNGRLEPSGEHIVDQWCTKHGIIHRLIPIGQKELNGKVENTHKQDDREFFSQNNFRSLKQLELLTISYNERWNYRRPTKALGWKTPLMALEAAYVRALVWIPMWLEKYGQLSEAPLYELDLNGDAFLPMPPMASTADLRRRGKGTKKISAVNRYLQWLEWDEKKSS